MNWIGRSGNRLAPVVGVGLAAIVATSLVTLSLLARNVREDPQLGAPVRPAEMKTQAAPPIELPGGGARVASGQGQPQLQPGEAPPQVLGRRIGPNQPIDVPPVQTAASPPPEEPKPSASPPIEPEPEPSPTDKPGGGNDDDGDGDDDGNEGNGNGKGPVVADRPKQHGWSKKKRGAQGHSFGHIKDQAKTGAKKVVEEVDKRVPPGHTDEFGKGNNDDDSPSHDFDDSESNEPHGHSKDHGHGHSEEHGNGHSEGHGNGKGHGHGR